MAADIEAILTGYLEAQLEVRAVAELPADLDQPVNLPINHVEEVPGPGADVPTVDVCDVDIDSYAVGREAARLEAERVRALVMAMAGLTFDDRRTVVARVQTARKPTILPYDDSETRRCGGSYRITLHSRA